MQTKVDLCPNCKSKYMYSKETNTAFGFKIEVTYACGRVLTFRDSEVKELSPCKNKEIKTESKDQIS
jgi:hypothetical protein